MTVPCASRHPLGGHHAGPGASASPAPSSLLDSHTPSARPGAALAAVLAAL